MIPSPPMPKFLSHNRDDASDESLTSALSRLSMRMKSLSRPWYLPADRRRSRGRGDRARGRRARARAARTARGSVRTRTRRQSRCVVENRRRDARAEIKRKDEMRRADALARAPGRRGRGGRVSSGEHDARGVSRGARRRRCGRDARCGVRRARSFLASRGRSAAGPQRFKDDQGDVGLGPMRARNHDTSRVSSKSMHPARARCAIA